MVTTAGVWRGADPQRAWKLRALPPKLTHLMPLFHLAAPELNFYNKPVIVQIPEFCEL